MSELTDFLLARFAEDEEVALRARDNAGRFDVPDHVVRYTPARVLAECKAKRRIVESRAAISLPSMEIHDEVQHQREYVWKLLALPYDSHPDYDERWRP